MFLTAIKSIGIALMVLKTLLVNCWLFVGKVLVITHLFIFVFCMRGDN